MVRCLTLVEFEDSVGHGGENSLPLQDIDVPDTKGQGKGGLPETQKQRETDTKDLEYCNPYLEQPLTHIRGTKADSRQSYIHKVTHSVQEALKEPLHGVQAGEHLLGVLATEANHL